MCKTSFLIDRFRYNYFLISLMHDYVIRSIFTTKLRLREILSTALGTFVLFSQGNFFQLCCFGNLFRIKLSNCIFKARLAGEICFCDAIKQAIPSRRCDCRASWYLYPSSDICFDEHNYHDSLRACLIVRCACSESW